MSTLTQKLNYCAVRVNDGSGCVYQPGEVSDYSYVLTVKHNIERGEVINEPHDIVVMRGNEPIDVLERYCHHDLDIAIIKIQYQGEPLFELSIGKPVKDEQLKIYGYPKYLQGETIPRATDITCGMNLEIDSNSFELETEHSLSTFNKSAQENVTGFSGSGIFKYDDEQIILKGIFPKLTDSEAAHNKVDGLYLKSFNDLLKSNGLPELVPPHLASFEFLRDKAFQLNLDVFQRDNLNRAISYLKLKAEEVIASEITPHCIKKLLNQRLLVDVSEVDLLSDSSIWEAWLELLTVLNIAKTEKCSLDSLEELFNTNRLQYLATKDDWTEHFHAIQYADYKGLTTNGGKVFIKTLGDSSDTGRLDIPENLIPNIARDFDFKLLKTDSGSHPFRDFKFYHVDYLKKKCLRDNEDSFKDLMSPEEIFNALKNEYSKLFN